MQRACAWWFDRRLPVFLSLSLSLCSPILGVGPRLRLSVCRVLLENKVSKEQFIL